MRLLKNKSNDENLSPYRIVRLDSGKIVMGILLSRHENLNRDIQIQY